MNGGRNKSASDAFPCMKAKFDYAIEELLLLDENIRRYEE